MPTPAELCATGGPGCLHCTDSVSIPLQLTHHGRGKAGGGSWPHTEHSTYRSETPAAVSPEPSLLLPS